MEDFLHFLFLSPFSQSLFFADFLTIRDHLVLVVLL